MADSWNPGWYRGFLFDSFGSRGRGLLLGLGNSVPIATSVYLVHAVIGADTPLLVDCGAYPGRRVGAGRVLRGNCASGPQARLSGPVAVGTQTMGSGASAGGFASAGGRVHRLVVVSNPLVGPHLT